MKEELTDDQIDQIIKAFDETLVQGPWEKSNFLRVIGKNLSEIRDNFLQQNGRTQSNSVMEAQSIEKNTQKKGEVEIFVSLYCSDGSNLQNWERIVTNLPRYVISRPIYAKEDNVKAIIKTKENKQNEAYVVLYINESDILMLSPDKTSHDKLGVNLLTLKDKAINLGKITRFVHVSGVYRWASGRLVKQP